MALPVVAAACFDKALVQGEVVSHAVAPALLLGMEGACGTHCHSLATSLADFQRHDCGERERSIDDN